VNRAEFALLDSVAFEKWASHQREALHRRAVEVLAHLAAYYERVGARSAAAWAKTRSSRWRAGEAMTLEQAIAYALETTSSPST
jgi:hypothetical protein